MAHVTQAKAPQSKLELKAKVAKYRAMARQFTDLITAENIHKLADEIEQQLRELDDFRQGG